MISTSVGTTLRTAAGTLRVTPSQVEAQLTVARGQLDRADAALKVLETALMGAQSRLQGVTGGRPHEPSPARKASLARRQSASANGSPDRFASASPRFAHGGVCLLDETESQPLRSGTAQGKDFQRAKATLARNVAHGHWQNHDRWHAFREEAGNVLALLPESRLRPLGLHHGTVQYTSGTGTFCSHIAGTPSQARGIFGLLRQVSTGPVDQIVLRPGLEDRTAEIQAHVWQNAARVLRQYELALEPDLARLESEIRGAVTDFTGKVKARAAQLAALPGADTAPGRRAPDDRVESIRRFQQEVADLTPRHERAHAEWLEALARFAGLEVVASKAAELALGSPPAA